MASEFIIIDIYNTNKLNNMTNTTQLATFQIVNYAARLGYSSHEILSCHYSSDRAVIITFHDDAFNVPLWSI